MKVAEKKPSVLLIEDDDEISKILGELMISWGYQIVKAHTLPSALIKVNNQVFNIIILDLILKKAPGIKLLEQIRRNANSLNHTTPIIIHSGHIEIQTMHGYKTDINDALVKPSPSELIRDKLAYWAERKHITTSRP